MFNKRVRNIKVLTSLILSGLFVMTGCGKKVEQIEDYGGQTAVESSTTGTDNTVSEEGISETDGSVTSSSIGTLSEKLGGDKVSFKDSVEVQGQFINIDINYDVPDVETIPTYKVKPITAENLKEDEIVANLFGDTAVPLDRELTKENGDNTELIDSAKTIFEVNEQAEHNTLQRCKGWIDADGFLFHTYEGKYRGIDYQLSLSYSDSLERIYILLYPKKFTDLCENPELEYCSITNIDGSLNNFYQNEMKIINIPEVMADRPNECTLSDEELSDLIRKSLSENFYLSIPEGEAGLTFHKSFFDGYFTVDESKITDDSKSELVFLAHDDVESDSLSGAIRHGYVGQLMCGLEDIAFTNKNSYFDPTDVGNVIVDNEGIISLQFAASYNFEEELSDNAELLNFNTAMQAFKKAASENLDLSQLSQSESRNLTFTEARLIYFPVSSPDNPDDTTYVPSWAVIGTNGGSSGNGHSILTIFIINALDGSFIYYGI